MSKKIKNIKNKKKYGGAIDIDPKMKKMIKKEFPSDIQNLIKEMKPKILYVVVFLKSDGQSNIFTSLGTFDDEKLVIKSIKKHITYLKKEKDDAFKKDFYKLGKDKILTFFSEKKKILFLPSGHFDLNYNSDFTDEQLEEVFSNSFFTNRKGDLPDALSSGFIIYKQYLNKNEKIQLIDI